VNEIFVDLIAERSDVLIEFQTHLLNQVRTCFDSNALESLHLNGYTSKSQEIARWQAMRECLTCAHHHIVFLIAPNAPLLQDPRTHHLWRETLNPWVRKGAVNLQIIRGSLAESNMAQSFFQNATFALVSALCSASPELAQMHSVQTEQALRPLVRSSRTLNFACDKCSDPECEHKLFGFLTKPSALRSPL
jgi:hypothetical protein